MALLREFGTEGLCQELDIEADCDRQGSGQSPSGSLGTEIGLHILKLKRNQV